MSNQSIRTRLVFALLAISVLSSAGAASAGQRGEKEVAARAVVVPDTASANPRVSSSMSAGAAESIKALGYDIVPSGAVSAVLRQANPANVQACLDKALFAIGKSLKADLVVCPRMAAGSFGVDVTFARVSKDRVWSCSQPVLASLSGDPDAYSKAVAFCVDQLLSPAPKTAGTSRTRKKIVVEQRRSSARKNYLGAAGMLVPSSRERFTGYAGEERFSKHLDYDLSWGASLFFDHKILTWITVGAELDWYSLGRKKAKSESSDDEETIEEPLPGDTMIDIDRLNAFDIGVSLRAFYPGKWVEPYLKVALGLAVAAARDKEVYKDVEIGAGAGVSYQVRAGLMAVFSYVGVFAELGFQDLMWIPSTAAYVEFDSAMVNDTLLSLSLGLAFVF